MSAGWNRAVAETSALDCDEVDCRRRWSFAARRARTALKATDSGAAGLVSVSVCTRPSQVSDPSVRVLQRPAR